MPVKILLAEDNDSVAYTFAQKPSLIIMDVQMPVMDGLEAIRQIRAVSEFAQTPIIALSGFAMPEDYIVAA